MIVGAISFANSCKMEADHITAESKAGSGGAHLSICHEEQL
jgi:hypothetical protein